MIRMSGQEIKATADAVGLTPAEVCAEASVSISTLYKVYNGDHVRTTTKNRVEQAIRRLSAKARAVAV
jgi:predicted transcriptional regulator